MEWMRRVLRNPASTTVFATVVALLAAVGVHGLKLAFAADDPEAVDLVEDMVRNVVVAGAVGLGTVWLDEQRRSAARQFEEAGRRARNLRRVHRLVPIAFNAADGWSVVPDLHTPPTIQDARDELARHAASFRETSEAIREADEATALAQMFVMNVNIVLAHYCAEGIRVRRFRYLERLSAELRDLSDDPESAWVDAVVGFRQAVSDAAVVSTGPSSPSTRSSTSSPTWGRTSSGSRLN